MTQQQIKTKIKERADWLKAHQSHPDYALVFKDWRELNKKLEELKPTKKQ